MKKIFTLFVVVFAAVSMNLSAEVIKTWDFTQWSDVTISHLLSDARSETNGWYVLTTELDENNNPKRFKNWGKSVEILVANGVEIEETKGILFPVGLTGGAVGTGAADIKGVLTDTKGDLNIRHNFGDDGIQCGSSNKIITIKDLKANQKVNITLKSASKDGIRGISEITNMTGAVGEATYKDGNSENTYDFTVTADGDATFKYSGGIIIKKIIVYTGELSINATNNDGIAAVSSEYFDITGKKVNESAKGFVIVKTTYEDGSINSTKVFNK